MQLYTPTLVVRQRWQVTTRNLHSGYTVIVVDRYVERNYQLGLIKEVFADEDGKTYIYIVGLLRVYCIFGGWYSN